MKKELVWILLILAFRPFFADAAHYAGELNGRILLQTEEHGEAWYVYPADGKKYYLGRPEDAFILMKKLSLGAKHDFIANTEIFPERLSGIILLDVQKNGEAYYIYPGDRKKYYLGRPRDAFEIMRNFGLGISNKDIVNIPVGAVENAVLHKPVSEQKILLKVPFTSQAPFGNWNDQRQQDGCEEASSLMAFYWAKNKSLTKEEALKEILAISDYLAEKYGEYRDISSADTIEWIFKDYLDYQNVIIKKNISPENIIEELKKGNLIITPMNGQIMHNDYYTPPGPPRHMIVIKGYDSEKKVFITNDPGTKNGESFPYDVDVLFDAIRDYPTGHHETIKTIEKNMLIISR